jgi:hypothetical protein
MPARCVKKSPDSYCSPVGRNFAYPVQLAVGHVKGEVGAAETQSLNQSPCPPGHRGRHHQVERILPTGLDKALVKQRILAGWGQLRLSAKPIESGRQNLPAEFDVSQRSHPQGFRRVEKRSNAAASRRVIEHAPQPPRLGVRFPFEQQNPQGLLRRLVSQMREPRFQGLSRRSRIIHNRERWLVPMALTQVREMSFAKESRPPALPGKIFEKLNREPRLSRSGGTGEDAYRYRGSG